MFGIPLVPPSISVHRYYSVFIDSYTRVSWVYLFCDCYEVITIVTHFIMEVVTQYSTIAKILRIDNSLKFVQTFHHTFFCWSSHYPLDNLSPYLAEKWSHWAETLLAPSYHLHTIDWDASPILPLV